MRLYNEKTKRTITISQYELFGLAFEAAQDIDNFYHSEEEAEWRNRQPTANAAAVVAYLTNERVYPEWGGTSDNLLIPIWESRDIDVMRAACCRYYNDPEFYSRFEDSINDSIERFKRVPPRKVHERTVDLERELANC